jgi:acyl-CoA reductase-like NAD-dependent aldehyde dehydrogenase
MFKKMSLELGGKNPNIIFADCNYDDMLETTVRSSFANQGQICLCGSRIFVERPIYERFKNDLVSRAMELNIGDPLDESTNIGAIVSRTHMEKIQSYIDLARTEGGKILSGGNRVFLDGRCSGGFFMEPTVIEGPLARLPHQSRRDLRPRRLPDAVRYRRRSPGLREFCPIRTIGNGLDREIFPVLTASRRCSSPGSSG